MKLPRFFEVDGTLVRFDADPTTGDVVSISEFGTPFPLVKAMEEGIEISKEEFNKLEANKSGDTVKYPRYFEIRGTLAEQELDSQTGEVKSTNPNGEPYPFEKALEGREITKLEYDGLVKLLYPNKKHLISLISTEGKSKEQMKNEAKLAYSKFIKTQGKSKEQVKNHGKII